MSEFFVGQKVVVRCHLDTGPVLDQVMATLRAGNVDITGTVKVTELAGRTDAEGWVRAEVLEVTEQAVTLRLPDTMSGEVYSRGGIATLPLTWAVENIEPGH
jgi:hypothetical protein